MFMLLLLAACHERAGQQPTHDAPLTAACSAACPHLHLTPLLKACGVAAAHEDRVPELVLTADQSAAALMRELCFCSAAWTADSAMACA